jgi:hypothetical protein
MENKKWFSCKNFPCLSMTTTDFPGFPGVAFEIMEFHEFAGFPWPYKPCSLMFRHCKANASTRNWYFGLKSRHWSRNTDAGPYSKSSLTLNEWRFNLSFSWVSMLFLNSWRVIMSSHRVRYDTSPPAIQKQHWHSREAQIEPPLIECEWAFRIQALVT